jgi:hypothetical protein
VISRWTFSRGQRSLRDVDGNKRSDAWVAMPSEEQARAMMGNANPYDFGSSQRWPD